ncbi:MAG: DUF4861 family protein [Chitinophagaceae bacterium]|nr:DUF4861 family protein [Chitinophagaceae bacterium]MCA6468064.1 DUF4861 family protein [Chitinophagaceae bacterium]MCA6470584.1 DUF4861 family protein [Chitinophagaceae bacterium]MCA6478347.1 DUF4861 family protein [Chitinophagaceae bacterium]MCA6479501.1 DUF4861 family protein [Chitinophagaceae bacterium]
MNNRKQLIFFICSVLSFLCATAQKVQPLVTISNPLHHTRIQQVISLPWSELKKNLRDIDTSRFSVVNRKTGKILTHQWETLGTGTIQSLLIHLPLAAKEQLQLGYTLKDATRPSAKVFGRHVPERKDDFAWENNRIAFRMYGKALQSTNENAHGIDVWVKRTDELVIDKWYQSGDYHTDKGEGLDYYSVGATLGAGDLSFFTNDSVFYPGNYSRWKILDKGPIRFSFQLTYDSVEFNKQYIQIIKTITLDAEAQLNRITVEFLAPNLQQHLAVTGIALRKGCGILNQNEQKGIITYWEPTDPKNGTTGIALIDTSGNKKIIQVRKQVGMQLLLKNQIPYTYYAGACWDKAGKIHSMEEWQSYIAQLYLELKQPLTIIFNVQPIKYATSPPANQKMNQ